MASLGQHHRTIDNSDPSPIYGPARGSANLCRDGSCGMGGGCSMGHSAWAKAKAIQNYERFVKSAFQIDIANAVIDTVEKTSLGVEGIGALRLR